MLAVIGICPEAANKRCPSTANWSRFVAASDVARRRRISWGTELPAGPADLLFPSAPLGPKCSVFLLLAGRLGRSRYRASPTGTHTGDTHESVERQLREAVVIPIAQASPGAGSRCSALAARGGEVAKIGSYALLTVKCEACDPRSRWHRPQLAMQSASKVERDDEVPFRDVVRSDTGTKDRRNSEVVDLLLVENQTACICRLCQATE